MYKAFLLPIVTRANAHSAIVPIAFQFYAFDPSPPVDDTSANQASFAALQCIQVIWLCICTILQPAMAVIYNLRSDFVTAETLLSNSVSNPAVRNIGRHGKTRTHIRSNRRAEAASHPRNSLDTGSSTRNLTLGIVQERTFLVEAHLAGDADIELQDVGQRRGCGPAAGW
jgi:hypothetical protein